MVKVLDFEAEKNQNKFKKKKKIMSYGQYWPSLV
jgi:hypothetical protein